MFLERYSLGSENDTKDVPGWWINITGTIIPVRNSWSHENVESNCSVILITAAYTVTPGEMRGDIFGSRNISVSGGSTENEITVENDGKVTMNQLMRLSCRIPLSTRDTNTEENDVQLIMKQIIMTHQQWATKSRQAFKVISRASPSAANNGG